MLPENANALIDDNEVNKLDHYLSSPSSSSKKGLGKQEPPCLFYTKQLDYWSYSLCPQSQIKQYHIENNVIQEDTIISLGKYINEEKGIEVYELGDECNKHAVKKRKSVVVYRCCDGENNKIINVKESNSCEYEFDVCLNSKCNNNYEEDNTSTAKGYTPEKKEEIKIKIKSMFKHAYDSYFYNAFPLGNLKPLSCRGGKFELSRIKMLTLIDSLDTLYILNNHTEFVRGIERLREFDVINEGFFRQDEVRE